MTTYVLQAVVDNVPLAMSLSQIICILVAVGSITSIKTKMKIFCVILVNIDLISGSQENVQDTIPPDVFSEFL